MWPTTWTSRAGSSSDVWRATRNVSSSGLGRNSFSLSSYYRSDTVFPFSPAHAGWVVSLSVGFRFGVRPPIHYTGTVILHFSKDIPTSCSSSTPVCPKHHTQATQAEEERTEIYFSYLPDTIHHRHSVGSGKVISTRRFKTFALSALALSVLILLSVLLFRILSQHCECAGQGPPPRRGSQELSRISPGRSREQSLLHERSPLLRNSLEDSFPRQEKNRSSCS